MTIRQMSRLFGATLITLAVPIVAASQASSNGAIFTALGMHEGGTACEIGAGDGALTIEAARLVGPSGRIYTNELGADHVKTLREKVEAARLAQITVIEGGVAKTNFPDGVCDAIFANDVYHHFADPAAMNAAMLAALKPGGRLALMDFTPPGKEAPKPAERGNDGMHGVLPETIARELTEAGFEIVSSSLRQRAVLVIAAKPKR